MDEQKIVKIRKILLDYLLPGCLKPEHDGMTTYELASLIVRNMNEWEVVRRKELNDWIDYNEKEGYFDEARAEEIRKMSLQEAYDLMYKLDAMADLEADKMREEEPEKTE